MALYTAPQRDFITWMAMQPHSFNTTLIPPKNLKDGSDVAIAWYNMYDFVETVRKCILDKHTAKLMVLAGIDWDRTLSKFVDEYAKVIRENEDDREVLVTYINKQRLRLRISIDEAMVDLEKTYGTPDYSAERDHYRARVLLDQRCAEDELNSLNA